MTSSKAKANLSIEIFIAINASIYTKVRCIAITESLFPSPVVLGTGGPLADLAYG